MIKIEYPALPKGEKPKLFWKDIKGDYICALVDKKEIVKIYLWDQIAKTYNEVFALEKVKGVIKR